MGDNTMDNANPDISTTYILILRKTLAEFSAGTRFRVTARNLVLGTITIESVYPMRGGKYRPRIDIHQDELYDWFVVARQRTFIVPAINGKERRRKVRLAMRQLREGNA